MSGGHHIGAGLTVLLFLLSFSGAMYPYKIHRLNDEENKKLMDAFKGEKSGFVQVSDKKWMLPEKFSRHAEIYYNLKVRKDDIWVVTFPRSGTTLTQELIWLINNNLDYDKASAVGMLNRFPFLDVPSLLHDEFIDFLQEENKDSPAHEEIKSWKKMVPNFIDELESPRHIKTHLPFSLLPPDLIGTAKVIYIARNPRDVAVSYYHHNKLGKLHDFVYDFKQYWNFFKNDQVVYAPFWEHINEGWQVKDKILFIFYEDMMKDMKSTIRKVADYLGKNITDNDVDVLADHLQIDNFKKKVPIHIGSEIKGIHNDYEHKFIRKGGIGKNSEFTEELKEDFEKWCQEKSAVFNIPFVYE